MKHTPCISRRKSLCNTNHRIAHEEKEKKRTHPAGNPLAADDGPIPRREPRQSLGKGRIHPQAFRDNRRQVGQPLDRLGLNVLFAREGAADLGDGLLERGRVPEQVEGDAGEARGRALAAGQDDERRVGVELLDRHRDAFLALDDVGQEIRVVRLGGDASVHLVAVQAEDFGLAGFHRFGNHQSNNLVQRGQLLAMLWIQYDLPHFANVARCTRT